MARSGIPLLSEIAMTIVTMGVGSMVRLMAVKGIQKGVLVSKVRSVLQSQKGGTWWAWAAHLPVRGELVEAAEQLAWPALKSNCDDTALVEAS